MLFFIVCIGDSGLDFFFCVFYGLFFWVGCFGMKIIDVVLFVGVDVFVDMFL